MSIKRGRDIFARYKISLITGSHLLAWIPRWIRIACWNHIADKKGKLRIAQRYMLLKTLAVSVGDNVSIHPMCYIQGSGGISIGNDVSIAHDVTLMTENHSYENLAVPIKDQVICKRPIVIEDNVWIGAKATVPYGRRVGSGSVVAVNAVVTKDV